MNKGLILVSVLVLLTGCTTINPYTGAPETSNTAIGAGVGAVGGALVGNLLGGDTGSTLVGAGIGAMVGSATGNYMDNQAAMLRQELQGSGVQVMRHGNDIRLIMPGNITFENDRAEIRANFYNTLNAVAIVLNKFANSTIRVTGYASSVGAAMHNQQLSEHRARSVADYLIAQKVAANRILASGLGARNFIASNATSEGQALNRRVEITIHSLAK